MDREQAKQAVRERLGDYLWNSGIDIGSDGRKNFSCLNPDHGDSNPSMGFDKDRNQVHCFGCDARYDVIDLIGMEEGITEFGDQLDAACDYFGIQIDGRAPRSGSVESARKDFQIIKPEEAPKETAPAPSEADIKAFIQEAHKHVKETDFFYRRGLTDATIDRFSLGYDPKTSTAIIPVGESYYIQRHVTEKRFYNLKGASSRLLNPEYLSAPDEPVFLVESALCALSIEQAGARSIALNSTSNRRQLIERCKKLHEEGKPLPVFILALDADAEGSRTEDELRAALLHMGALLERMEFPDTIKDPNEWLQNNPIAFSEAIDEAKTRAEAAAQTEAERERNEYLSTNTAQHLAGFFDHIKDKENTKAVPTGFPALDKILDGGVYPGFYVMGAISSLGKTTIALQMVDNMAEAGTDVLIFSLEMARYELIAKSLSRHTAALDTTMSKTLSKSTREITTHAKYKYYKDDELDLLQKAVDAYEKAGERIYIHEGIGDIGPLQIRETVEKHIRITGRVPVVLIDYLQILAPTDTRATDKQNTDKAVTELKRLSRDFRTPVLAISSLNRDNYTNAISMAAFKESGAIEYSSDVLIGLQFAGITGKAEDRIARIEEAKQQMPREIELKILKNRNGRTGDTVNMQYYPRFNMFKERS